jgi:hypothetical protein
MNEDKVTENQTNHTPTDGFSVLELPSRQPGAEYGELLTSLGGYKNADCRSFRSLPTHC